MAVKKTSLVEAGQGICIGVVALYAAYAMFPGALWRLLWGVLPWLCGLSLITYALYNLELE